GFSRYDKLDNCSMAAPVDRQAAFRQSEWRLTAQSGEDKHMTTWRWPRKQEFRSAGKCAGRGCEQAAAVVTVAAADASRDN
ncbi:hypothetical protein Dimus_022648, partial [Dionaea muscipula]